MTQLLPRYRVRDDDSIAAKLAREGRCRMCQRPWHVRAPTRHHLVPYAERGRVVSQINDPRNIVPLCRACHDLIDNPRDRQVQRIARAMLRGLLAVEEAEFVARWMGSGWLNRHYPRPWLDDWSVRDILGIG